MILRVCLYFGNGTTLTYSATCWKFSSTEVITFFHSLMINGLKWNFCLFEQEGTGINYNIFPPFNIQFCCALRCKYLLDTFNVYLSCSSPIPHWIHSLWNPTIIAWRHFSFLHDHILLECFTIYIWILLQHFWMSDGSAAVSVCSPWLSRESPSLTMMIRRVFSRLTLFYC